METPFRYAIFDARGVRPADCRMKMENPKLYGSQKAEVPYKNEKVFFIRQFQGDFPYEMRKLKSIRQLGKKVAV